METMMVKYAPELELIKNEPDSNRIAAIKRFFLLMDFENTFLPIQREQHGGKLSRTKAVTAYCGLRGIPERTFYRWIIIYRKKGIKGLVPKYGKKAKRLYKRHRGSLIVNLTIDTKNPLKCLTTLQKTIERCTLIQPEVKHTSLKLLKSVLKELRPSGRLSLRSPLTDSEIAVLMRFKSSNHKHHSKKASAILMANEGRTLLETIETTHAPERSIYRWLHNFNKDHLESIKVHVHAPAREQTKEERQTRVIDIIHKMPSLYGINRTTWTYSAIAEAYQKEYGTPISVGKIEDVIHNTDYSWRHARKVLTSLTLITGLK